MHNSPLWVKYKAFGSGQLHISEFSQIKNWFHISYLQSVKKQLLKKMDSFSLNFALAELLDWKLRSRSRLQH